MKNILFFIYTFLSINNLIQAQMPPQGTLERAYYINQQHGRKMNHVRGILIYHDSIDDLLEPEYPLITPTMAFFIPVEKPDSLAFEEWVHRVLSTPTDSINGWYRLNIQACEQYMPTRRATLSQRKLLQGTTSLKVASYLKSSLKTVANPTSINFTYTEIIYAINPHATINPEKIPLPRIVNTPIEVGGKQYHLKINMRFYVPEIGYFLGFYTPEKMF